MHITRAQADKVSQLITTVSNTPTHEAILEHTNVAGAISLQLSNKHTYLIGKDGSKLRVN